MHAHIDTRGAGHFTRAQEVSKSMLRLTARSRRSCVVCSRIRSTPDNNFGNTAIKDILWSVGRNPAVLK
jgi:hypothetical protein